MGTKRNRPLQAAAHADVARTATTTLAADSHMVLPMDADSTYSLELGVMWTNAGAGDFKWGLGGPTGAKAFETSLGIAGQDIGAANDNMGDTSTSDNGSLNRRMIITTAAAHGDLTFYWAQNTSDAGATTRKKGSFLRLEKVS